MHTRCQSLSAVPRPCLPSTGFSPTSWSHPQIDPQCEGSIAQASGEVIFGLVSTFIETNGPALTKVELPQFNSFGLATCSGWRFVLLSEGTVAFRDHERCVPIRQSLIFCCQFSAKKGRH